MIVESNVREVKVHSPDYKGVEADEVFLFSYSLEIGHNNIEFTSNMLVPKYLLFSGHH